MGPIYLALRLVLAATFAVAGVAKLADREGSRQAALGFGIPERVAGPAAIVLPLVELAAAALLIPTATARVGAALALALLLAFGAAITRSMLRGEAPDCHCFGQLHSAPAGPKMLARNMVLALAAVVVLVGGAGTSATHWITRLDATGAVALAAGAALALIAAASGALALALLRRHGDTLLRLEALEAALAAHGISVPSLEAPAPEGLPVGSAAPEFELPDLDGTRVTLASLRMDAKPVMLVFTDPGCGPCSALMPQVAEWQREDQSTVRIALISGGELDANRADAREHGLSDVIIQRAFEVSESYGVSGTPSAVLIAPDGTVASPVHGGAEAIASLISQVAAPPQLAVHQHQPVIARPAPDPMLRTLDGDRVALRERLDGETAVLFWNPDCGFCDQMLADLRRVEAAATTEMPNLVLISTGDAARNRAMALRAPILLDDGFTAGAFGATGTPSAVLVDEQGRIASAVAVGAPDVLALVGTDRAALSTT
jgi:methylamine dehydrogenase accessory protein MauD